MRFGYRRTNGCCSPKWVDPREEMQSTKRDIDDAFKRWEMSGMGRREDEPYNSGYSVDPRLSKCTRSTSTSTPYHAWRIKHATRLIHYRGPILPQLEQAERICRRRDLLCVLPISGCNRLLAWCCKIRSTVAPASQILRQARASTRPKAKTNWEGDDTHG